ARDRAGEGARGDAARALAEGDPRALRRDDEPAQGDPDVVPRRPARAAALATAARDGEALRGARRRGARGARPRAPRASSSRAPSTARKGEGMNTIDRIARLATTLLACSPLAPALSLAQNQAPRRIDLCEVRVRDDAELARLFAAARDPDDHGRVRD